MGKRGHGYGSEDNLLRYRAEHPAVLNEAILSCLNTPNAELTWLYPRDGTCIDGAKELEGLEFLDDKIVMDLWRDFWPQTGKQPTWDGAAKLVVGSQTEWILLEAKANWPELCSPPSGAKSTGREKIETAMGTTKNFVKVHRRFHWLGTYYQYANRLACLYFLTQVAKIPAKLVFVYFYGDTFEDATPCPKTEAEWRPLITACHLTLGLSERHPLSSLIGEVFLPPCPK
jgi:hypothetical protein